MKYQKMDLTLYPPDAGWIKDNKTVVGIYPDGTVANLYRAGANWFDASTEMWREAPAFVSRLLDVPEKPEPQEPKWEIRLRNPAPSIWTWVLYWDNQRECESDPFMSPEGATLNAERVHYAFAKGYVKLKTAKE